MDVKLVNLLFKLRFYVLSYLHTIRTCVLDGVKVVELTERLVFLGEGFHPGGPDGPSRLHR